MQVDALTAEGGAPAAADPARHQRAVLLLELLTRVCLRIIGVYVFRGCDLELPTSRSAAATRCASGCSREAAASSVADCPVCA
jgi:hypothetical protein